ncbi:MAG: histidine utilization repressor [Kangiellaceae bacterium]|nr:histidine utilization repressor [Kangiellaceae bacterium]
MSKTSTLYIHVKDYVLAGISNGSWLAGERVPSENELVDLCKVSRMTARRALQELLLEGTLVRIKGKGSYVAQEKQHSSLLQISSISTEIRARGMEYKSELVQLSVVNADDFLAHAMGIKRDFQLYHSTVLHFQNDLPIQLELRWVIPEAAPEYINQSFLEQTPGEYLTELAPVTEAEHNIEAVIGNRETRELLTVQKEEALLLLSRKTWCGVRLVSFAKLYHPGDSYSFGTKFKPNK